MSSSIFNLSKDQVNEVKHAVGQLAGKTPKSCIPFSFTFTGKTSTGAPMIAAQDGVVYYGNIIATFQNLGAFGSTSSSLISSLNGKGNFYFNNIVPGAGVDSNTVLIQLNDFIFDQFDKTAGAGDAADTFYFVGFQLNL